MCMGSLSKWFFLVYKSLSNDAKTKTCWSVVVLVLIIFEPKKHVGDIIMENQKKTFFSNGKSVQPITLCHQDEIINLTLYIIPNK